MVRGVDDAFLMHSLKCISQRWLITFNQTRPTNRCEYKKSHTYHINYNTFVYLTKNLIIFVAASIRFKHKWWKNKAVIKKIHQKTNDVVNKNVNLFSLSVNTNGFQ